MGLFEIRVAQPHHYPYEFSRPQLGISPWFALRISHENVLIVVDVTPWLLLQYHHLSIHVSINKKSHHKWQRSPRKHPNISEYPQLLSPFLVVSPDLIHVISLKTISPWSVDTWAIHISASPRWGEPSDYWYAGFSALEACCVSWCSGQDLRC